MLYVIIAGILLLVAVGFGVAATARAEQERARIDNETAKLREQSGALSPAANQRFCLDIVNAWDVSKNGPLPATFNCGMGNSAGVLVGAK